MATTEADLQALGASLAADIVAGRDPMARPEWRALTADERHITLGHIRAALDAAKPGALEAEAAPAPASTSAPAPAPAPTASSLDALEAALTFTRVPPTPPPPGTSFFSVCRRLMYAGGDGPAPVPAAAAALEADALLFVRRVVTGIRLLLGEPTGPPPPSAAPAPLPPLAVGDVEAALPDAAAVYYRWRDWKAAAKASASAAAAAAAAEGGSGTGAEGEDKDEEDNEEAEAPATAADNSGEEDGDADLELLLPAEGSPRHRRSRAGADSEEDDEDEDEDALFHSGNDEGDDEEGGDDGEEVLPPMTTAADRAARAARRAGGVAVPAPDAAAPPPLAAAAAATKKKRAREPQDSKAIEEAQGEGAALEPPPKRSRTGDAPSAPSPPFGGTGPVWESFFTRLAFAEARTAGMPLSRYRAFVGAREASFTGTAALHAAFAAKLPPLRERGGAAAAAAAEGEAESSGAAASARRLIELLGYLAYDRLTSAVEAANRLFYNCAPWHGRGAIPSTPEPLAALPLRAFQGPGGMPADVYVAALKLLPPLPPELEAALVARRAARQRAAAIAAALSGSRDDLSSAAAAAPPPKRQGAAVKGAAPSSSKGSIAGDAVLPPEALGGGEGEEGGEGVRPRLASLRGDSGRGKGRGGRGAGAARGRK